MLVSIHLNTLTYIPLQQEIDRGIFTRWFHLVSIFSRAIFIQDSANSSSLSSSLHMRVFVRA